MTDPSQLQHFVKMADSEGQLLGVAQHAILMHSHEFSSVTATQERINDAFCETEALFLRWLPWPVDATLNPCDDMRVVNWPVLQLDPQLMNLLGALQEIVGRPMARAAFCRVKPKGIILPFTDVGLYSSCVDRFHFVVQSSEEAINTAAGEQAHLPVGSLWWVNHKGVEQSFENPSDAPTSHLIFDAWRP